MKLTKNQLRKLVQEELSKATLTLEAPDDAEQPATINLTRKEVHKLLLALEHALDEWDPAYEMLSGPLSDLYEMLLTAGDEVGWTGLIGPTVH